MEILLIGHPVLDQVDSASYSLIGECGLVLGETVRRSTSELDALASRFPHRRLTPGGSAANTASLLAAHGRRVGLAGLIADDPAGRLMARAYDAAGIDLLTPPREGAEPTTTALILSTSDGRAATAICVGVTERLTAAHLPDVPPRTRWVFVEGRVLDQVGAGPLTDYIDHARDAGASVAFSLSGRREIRLHRKALRKTVARCGLVLGTEEEFADLADTGPRALLTGLSSEGTIAVMTRGDLGAVVAEDGRLRAYPALAPAAVVDTTGAGDAFAAGFLLSATADGTTDDAMASAACLASHMVGHPGGWACDCPTRSVLPG
ncbi:ketohexokinase/fructokinase/ribokinase [Streptomyces sp. T12]|nr:ketohexokinase/fructokinase/ribokinase [Streptomyces sp. T12]